LTVDKTGQVVLVANYGSGSVESIPLAKNGELQEPASVIQHSGQVALPKRQGGPHAHSINVDAANRFAFAADLGLDKIFVYKLDPSHGTLTPNDPPSVSVKPGSGPRHFAFHPSGKFAYACEEISSEVTAFAYDAAKGVLTELQTLSTLPADYDKPGNSTAEVQVHPSGKFVYVSNRGHDSLAIFTVDEKTGKLTAAGHQSTGGKTPRNFGIDPTGAYILAANQGTGNVVVLSVNQATGQLKPTGTEIEIPAPVCVKFLAR
jgi:6-phosphogluconolactonase